MKCNRRRALAILGATGLTACSAAVVPEDGSTEDTTATDPDATSVTDDGTSMDQASSCTPGAVALGPVSQFALGTWQMVRLSGRLGYIVGHDAGGLFAFSGLCTHQGCLVNVTASTGASICPCHSARFDGNGAVTLGPATRPLAHYPVVVCNGMASLDSTRTVPTATRTPV